MPAATVYDESTRAYWFDDADTPASLAAIHTGELADAIDLSGYVTPDGLVHGASDQRVDGADLLTAFDAESMGRYGNQPSLMLKRKLRNGGEVAFNTFKTRKQAGTLVIFETLAPGVAPAAGAAYVAYPECESGQWLRQNTAKNQEVRGQVNFAVGAAPVEGALVLGS